MFFLSTSTGQFMPPEPSTHISHDFGGMHRLVHLPLLRKVHRHWKPMYMKSSCAHRAKFHLDLLNWKSLLRWFYRISEVKTCLLLSISDWEQQQQFQPHFWVKSLSEWVFLNPQVGKSSKWEEVYALIDCDWFYPSVSLVLWFVLPLCAEPNPPLT